MDEKKKSVCASEQRTERIKELRTKFLEFQKKLSSEEIVCLDETGFKLNMISHYAWSPKGTRAKDYAPGAKCRVITTIGAISRKGFVCSAIGYGGTSSNSFYAFMKDELFPRLKKGTIIILDNLSAHKDKRVKSLAEKLGIKLVFQPPYSPEFNPIELAWNTIKTFIRARNLRTLDDLEKGFLTAIDTIPPKHFQRWFQKCGF